MNLDIINTCHPDVWKWNKTFINYVLCLKLSVGIDTVTFVEILTHSTRSTGTLTGSKLF